MYRRAGKLYIWAVLLTWLAVYAGTHHGGVGIIKEGLWIDPPIREYLYKTLTLQYSYGWADFLQYYVTYMLFAPLALWLCIKGRARLVLLTSLLIWCLRGDSFIISWQLLFIGGIVVGYYLPAIEKWFLNLSRNKRHYAIIALGILTVATILFGALTNRISVYFTETYQGLANLPGWFQSTIGWLYNVRGTITPWIYKWTLEPLRLVTALIWFTTFYMVVRQYEYKINQLTRGVLKTIGEASLLIYGVHAVLVFLALMLLPIKTNIVYNTVMTAIAVLIIYGVARYRYIVRRYKQRLLTRLRTTRE